MNNEEIEKLKEERDAAIEAGLKLAERFRESVMTDDLTPEDIAAVLAVEAFKPKPEPLECWVNTYGPNHQYHHSEESARSCAGHAAIRTAVHLREVTPIEWGRWDYGSVNDLYEAKSTSGWIGGFTVIADAHNAEMQRVTGTEGK